MLAGLTGEMLGEIFAWKEDIWADELRCLGFYMGKYIYIMDGEDYKEIEKLIKISTNLKEEDIKDFHTKMWIFCHGIASLVANNTIILTDEQIKQLLSYEFQALMLLEENPKNKWVFVKVLTLQVIENLQ